MEVFSEAGIDRLRAKSVSLTGYMEFLLRQNASSEFSIITPVEEKKRGAQLSIRLAHHGRAFAEKLAAAGVIGDWREPDIFRVAAVPLYNSFHGVYAFVQRFTAALGQFNAL
jgi:kynureninase